MTKIFISYRRTGGRDIARSIYLALGKSGYNNVFFDYNSLRDGVFNEKIVTAIEECTDFILVLTKESMSRCKNDGDWVAKEIETALTSNSHIIPVNINNEFGDFPIDFPERLALIKDIHFLTLHTDDSFESDIERLIARLYTKRDTNTLKEKTSLSITSDETCNIYINEDCKGKLKSGNIKTYALDVEKKYIVKAVSLARKNIILQEELIPTEAKEQIIEFSFIKELKEREEKKRREQEQRKKEKNDRLLKEQMLKSVLDTYDDYYKGECGMVMVKKNKKLGFVNEFGFETIPCQYDDAVGFYEGYSFVKSNDHWICIDRSGNHIDGSCSATPSVIHGGRGIIQRNGDYFFFSPTDEICSDCKFENLFFTENKQFYIAQRNNKYSIIDASNGKPIVNDSFDEFSACRIYIYGYYESPIGYYFPLIVRKDNKYGVINYNGILSVPFISTQIINIGRTNRLFMSINEKFALIDIVEGKYLTPPIYDFACYFPCSESEFLLVGINCYIVHDHFATGGMQGLIDEDGNEIIPLIYHEIKIDDDGTIRCYQGDGFEFREDPEFHKKYFNKKVMLKYDRYDNNGTLLSKETIELKII